MPRGRAGGASSSYRLNHPRFISLNPHFDHEDSMAFALDTPHPAVDLAPAALFCRTRVVRHGTLAPRLTGRRPP